MVLTTACIPTGQVYCILLYTLRLTVTCAHRYQVLRLCDSTHSKTTPGISKLAFSKKSSTGHDKSAQGLQWCKQSTGHRHRGTWLSGVSEGTRARSWRGESGAHLP